MKKNIVFLFIAVYVLGAVMPAFALETEYINVALHQNAEASSCLSSECSAQMAIDGINDNESKTAWKSAKDDTMPWWQVDLNFDYSIYKIELEAPNGNIDTASRKDFRIIGSKDKDFKNHVVLVPEIVSEYDKILSAEISSKEEVRYIRVEKTKHGSLSIGEMRVYIKRGDSVSPVPTEDIKEIAPVIPESVSSEMPLDIVGTKYESAVSLLSSLGIMRGYEDGLFLPDKLISRAEFSKVAVNLTRNYIQTDETTFMDVSNGHWAHDYIESAVSQKLINGIGNGYFKPDEPISLPQAVKILVSVLGYGDFANNNGGYPAGYENVARRVKLTNGISFSDTLALTRGEVALLVFNTLECNKMEMTGVYDDYIVNEVIKGETLLSINFNIAKDAGVVTAADGISLTNEVPSIKKNTLAINGNEFSTELVNLGSYLGMNVNYYYNLKDKNKIVAMTYEDQNQVLSLDYDELLNADNYILTYGDEKTKRAKLSPKMDVLYNGVPVRDYKNSDLLPNDGYVKLIDNDGDSYFDVYFIYDEKHYLVSWVNTQKNTIYLEGREPLVLDEYETLYSISKDDKEISIDSIKENDIVSLMASRNKNGDKVYRIVVCDDIINGDVTEITDDTVYIDDVEYEYTLEFDVSSLGIRRDYLFRLDDKGRIFCFDTTKAGYESYGYLIDIGRESGFENVIKFKLFDEDGKVKILNAVDSEKLMVDGYNYSDYDKLLNHLTAYGKEAGKVHQPIKYAVTGRGLVNSVDTVYKGEEDESITKDYSAERRYYKSTGVVGMQFGLDDKTVMLKVPTDITREDEFAVLTKNSLGNNQQYTMEAYDCGEDKIAGMLLFTGSTSSSVAEAMLFMVDMIKTTVDSYGEPRKMLCGLYKGEMTQYAEYEEGIIDKLDLKRGDIVGLTLSENNEIRAVSKKFYIGDKPANADEKSISTVSPQYGNPYSTIYYGYGKVISKNNGYISIEYDNSQDKTYKSMLVNLNDKELSIYYYDKEADKVIFGSAEYVMDANTVGEDAASHVMINVDSGDVKEIIIFN